MREILLAVLALARASAQAVLTPATMLRFNTDKENLKIANQSLKFVNIIKEDLRKNNDDYAAAMMLEQQQPLPPKPQGAPSRTSSVPLGNHPTPLTSGAPHRGPPTRAPAKLGPPVRKPRRGPTTRQPPYRDPPRRAPTLRVSQHRGPPTRKQPILQLPNHDARRGLNVTINRTGHHHSAGNDTMFRSYSNRLDKLSKKGRFDNLKWLINKGKKLRAIARTSTTPQGGAAPYVADGANAHAVNEPPGAIAANEPHVHHEPHAPHAPHGGHALHGAHGRTGIAGEKGANVLEKDIYQEVQEGVTAYRPGHTPGKSLRVLAAPGSPSPDQLDMAPARGPHVQVIRYKGRLCQRSMLHVEGPRYDSKGSTIQPEWDPELDGPFGLEVPIMILPRCCNCCRKSVLGCQ